jgi:2-methylisocitrate lyase-like PEP mutase family enzyme
MMSEQGAKYEKFKALHYQDHAFVIPNAWDAGSTRVLTAMGFEAIATTSAGYAFSVGKRDSFAGLSRDEILMNAQAIVSATDLPVSADLEDGFGASPNACAATIALGVDVGLVGGSIEDATGDQNNPIYGLGIAVDRVKAAADAAKDKPFLLTARAEGFLYGQDDLGEIIKRLQAFSDAGADVLYAPGLPDLDAIRTVCGEVDKPLNVLMGLQGPRYSVNDISNAGARRISVGGSFARAAMGALKRAADEVLQSGTFDYAKDAIPDAELAQMMSQEKTNQRDE